MEKDTVSLKQELLRIKNQWFLVSLTALIYLYVAYIYFKNSNPEADFLNNAFLYAIILKGIIELGSIVYYSRKIIVPISIGPIFDISLASILYLFPLIAVILLPFFLAGSEWIRSICSVYIYYNLSKHDATNLYWLNAVAWFRIVLGVLMIISALINQALLAAVFLATALILFYFIAKLLQAGK